jgi:hypothetical protein
MKTLLFFLFLSLGLNAQELIFLEEKEFKPHMLDHLHFGCPPNAHCSADYGKARTVWRQALDQILASDQIKVSTILEQVRKDVGMPFTIWAKPESLEDQSLTSWDSSCRRHNLETGEIYWGEVLLRNLNDRNEEERPFIYNRVAMEQGDQIRLIRTPRDALPSMIIDNQLYYTLGEAGVYFGLLINQAGELRIIEPASIPHAAKEVACPDALKKQLESWPHFSVLYESSYCRAVWDQTRQSWTTIAVGWAC